MVAFSCCSKVNNKKRGFIKQKMFAFRKHDSTLLNLIFLIIANIFVNAGKVKIVLKSRTQTIFAANLHKKIIKFIFTVNWNNISIFTQNYCQTTRIMQGNWYFSMCRLIQKGQVTNYS